MALAVALRLAASSGPDRDSDFDKQSHCGNNTVHNKLLCADALVSLLRGGPATGTKS